MAMTELMPGAFSTYVDEFQWTTGETLMTSWQFLVGVHVAYATVLLTLTKFMEKREPLKGFTKAFAPIHNMFMSVLSLVMLAGLIYGGIVQGRFDSLFALACKRTPEVQPGLVQFSMYVFYLSKMLEFIDTFLLVMNKKKLIWLHKIHHLTTMSLVWHAMHINLASDILCAGLNCFVHVIMYFHFASPMRALRPVITLTQIAQFVIVLAGLSWAYYRRTVLGEPCSGTEVGEYHGLAMYGVYLAMFANFFIMQYLKPKKSKTVSQTSNTTDKPKKELLIGKRVYDVTDFKHPGGSVIKFCVGTDATATFEQFHIRSAKAEKFLKALPSREATADDLKTFLLPKTTELLKDFAKLQTDLKNEGFFKPSIPHIAWRIFEVVAMHLVGLYLLINKESLGAKIGALVVLGLAQGRCGWLMHEGGHYSLTGNITIDRHLQMAIYGLGCGMSGAWWRNQHNKHHATPQKLKHDVDLDTLPLVAFHSKLASKVRNPLVVKWLKLQGFLFAPVSTLLVTLGWQLYLHPRHSARTNNMVELGWMGLRYALWAAGAYYFFGLKMGLAYYMIYDYIGASYIFINFAVSHTHRDVVDADKHVSWVHYSSDFTTNCSPSLLCNWWMSYLNFQIEHHLFPSLPQFRHPIIAPRVKALFEKHGLVYDVRGYWECMRVTFLNLHNVGQTAGTAPRVESEAKKSSKSSDKKRVAIVLHGKELDLTNWLHKHPGGAKVLRIFHERDATEQFQAFHSPAAVKRMEIMLKAAKPIAKGHPAYVEPGTALAKSRAAFQNLLGDIVKKGYFKANVFHEILKFTWNMSLYAGALYLLLKTDSRYGGAALLSFAWQQSGWVGHDYSHHSIFPSPVLNDVVANFLSWLQGYELMWWKARHNTHHVTTNEVGNDPDIRTAPLLTYVTSGSKGKKALNWLQRQQHIYFLPVLGVLHLYWRLESLFFIMARLPKMLPNLLALVVHYVGLYHLFAPIGIGPLAFAITLKGAMTGACVFATHYGEERLGKDPKMSFAEQTVRTSRNIAGGWLMNTFSGNISMQVEHHLFPRMPTSNYTKVAPMVQKFCEEHGFQYNADNIVVCMQRNIEQLRETVDFVKKESKKKA